MKSAKYQVTNLKPKNVKHLFMWGFDNKCQTPGRNFVMGRDRIMVGTNFNGVKTPIFFTCVEAHFHRFNNYETYNGFVVVDLN